MAEELELRVPGEDETPLKQGGYIALSFFVFGSFPLIAHTVAVGSNVDAQTQFASSCIVVCVVLFGLGMTKARYSDQHLLHGGCELLVFGACIAAVSYFVAQWTSEIIGS